MAELTIAVTIEQDGATKTEIREYIKSAIQSYGGGLHPNDPLFSRNLKTTGRVKFRVIKEKP